MEIIFTKHAIKLIEERNILLKEIVECLASPNAKKEKFSKVVYLKIDENKNKLLVLICKEEKDSCIIITAFKMSKIQKYI